MVTEIEGLQKEVADLKMIMVEQARKIKVGIDEIEYWKSTGHNYYKMDERGYNMLKSAHKVLSSVK